MYAISVMMEIKAERVEDFKAAVLAHADNTKTNESGCLGFAVFQAEGRPELFYLHEVYVNKQAVEQVHKKAPYLAAFGEATKDWVLNKDLKTWETAEL